MKSLQDKIFTGFVILILVSVVSSSCPEDCICQFDYSGKLPNHIKCSSLNGLIGEERNLSIHSLDLSNANLHRISHTLEKLKDLVTLDLSHNSLSDIGRLGKRIKTLKLNHNKITSGKLTKFPSHVENLDLSFNDITYLPLEITKLKNLKDIQLSGNTLNCTCQTLEVRDWMVDNEVQIDNVKCSYPVEIKGHQLSEVTKWEICGHKDVDSTKSANINDLMLGDQAVISEGSGDVDDDDELGGAFMLLSKNDNKKLERMVRNDQVEGSGDDETEGHSDDETEEDEGSGSGGGAIPFEDTLIFSTPGFESSLFGLEKHGLGILQIHNETTTTELIPEEVTDELIVPAVLIHDTSAFNPMSTHKPEEQELEDDADENDDEELNQAGQEDANEKVTTDSNDSLNVQKASIMDGNKSDTADQEAGAGDNKNTYILLAIVLIILLGLIVFVAVKRAKATRRSRRLEDPESPRSTELQDMDKKALGKPIHKNGNAEHAPLIDDRNKVDISKPVNGNKKVPYVPHDDKDGNIQEPLLKNKEQPEPNDYTKTPGPPSESNNNVPPRKQVQPHTETPVENHNEVPKPATRQSSEKPAAEPRKGGYPPPKSPRAKKPSMGDDEVFHPSSPKPTSRYSPVYSPETGRVKIKLTETPKPKTPLLVTRSRSNAGDIVTTPTGNQQIPDTQ